MAIKFETMSPKDVRRLARDDGYDLTYAEAAAVVAAASEGRLLWTRERITVVGRDAFDARPGEERDR